MVSHTRRKKKKKLKRAVGGSRALRTRATLWRLFAEGVARLSAYSLGAKAPDVGSDRVVRLKPELLKVFKHLDAPMTEESLEFCMKLSLGAVALACDVELMSIYRGLRSARQPLRARPPTSISSGQSLRRPRCSSLWFSGASLIIEALQDYVVIPWDKISLTAPFSGAFGESVTASPYHVLIWFIHSFAGENVSLTTVKTRLQNLEYSGGIECRLKDEATWLASREVTWELAEQLVILRFPYCSPAWRKSIRGAGHENRVKHAQELRRQHTEACDWRSAFHAELQRLVAEKLQNMQTIRKVFARGDTLIKSFDGTLLGEREFEAASGRHRQ